MHLNLFSHWRLTIFAVGFLAAPAAHCEPAIDALVAAYPQFLAGSDDKGLIWRDGTRMPLTGGVAGKTFQQLLETPDIEDQFAIPYPLGGPLRRPALDEDPGRIRYQPLFLKMYGDCRKGQVARHLKSIPWLANKGDGTIRATAVNGVADKLIAISRELERLPRNLVRFAVPSYGVYNCRPVRGTRRLSMHAYGAAIDLNIRYADYWLWEKSANGKIRWKNRIPQAIVEIFERHGFIWGGKWYHYDTMHFEYRPELIGLAKRGWRAPKKE
jgi:D-alanyl-D-alanine carboxypeptidase